MKKLLFILSIFTQFSVFSQTKLSSDQAYEYLQLQRNIAQQLYENIKNPPKDSLIKAENILENALKYYFRTDVVDLAKTNRYLFARETDIKFDLAFVKIVLNKIDEAVQLYKKNFEGNSGSVYYNWIKDEPEFEKIKNSPHLTSIINKFVVEKNIFDSDALKTKYQANISEAEKLAGLSKFWSEAKYNFAYFENVPTLNWDQLYLEYIPKIQATKSTLEYLKVMQQFCAALKDGHTNVWATSDSLNSQFNYKPPIRTNLIENKVFITQITNDSLANTVLKTGMEIISIDNIPVKEYAEKFVKPYQSASTEQDLTLRMYNYSLLRGNIDKPIELQLKDLNGKVFTQKIARKGYKNNKITQAFEYKILPGNITYFAINEFESDKATKKFISAFDTISKTNAIILDIRTNGGGDTDYIILSYLTDKPIPYGQQFVRKYVPTYRARGEGVVWQKEPDSAIQPNGIKNYSKPIVLLTGPQTFSAAEDFAIGFESIERGKIIGEPTGGSTGQPLAFSIPGGLMARVCTKRDLYPDGKKFIGVGIIPDIIVKPTIVDLKAGKDTILNSALEYLKGKL